MEKPEKIYFSHEEMKEMVDFLRTKTEEFSELMEKSKRNQIPILFRFGDEELFLPYVTESSKHITVCIPTMDTNHFEGIKIC